MLKDNKIAVIVPAYNEHKLITEVVNSIPDYVDCIIVVDDASEPSLQDIIEETSKQRVLYIRHDKNQGVGGSIVSGYKHAMLSGYDIMAVMAGDAQMHPDDLIKVVSPVIKGEADYSKGNRFMSHGCFSRMPVIRILGNCCFSVMSCVASGYYHIFDTQCGFSAINIKSLQNLDLDNLFYSYGFPTDILAKLSMISAKVVDVPVRAVYNTETSGIRPFSYTLAIIFLTLKLFFKRQVKKIKKKRVLLQDY